MRCLLIVLLLFPAVTDGQIRLMSEEQDTRLRKLLPWVDDPDIQDILNNPQTVLYTDEEIRPAYQDFTALGHYLRDPGYNHSGDFRENSKGHGNGGNGNVEFPWKSPAGTDNCTNVATFRFFRLPAREGGGFYPVVHWMGMPAYQKQLALHPNYRWIFPTGTVFGEVLTMRNPQTQQQYTFELRTRTREPDQWAVDVFRPYPAASDLAAAITKLRPQWREDEALSRLMDDLGRDRPDRTRTLKSKHLRKVVFEERAGEDTLDAIDPQLVNELLTAGQFRTALGVLWKDDTHAPTTEADWHIVPKGYQAGYIPVDSESCTRCHDSCNKHVSVFEARDWYGNVRGSDGIFTWHMFEAASVAGFELRGAGRSPVIRQDFVRQRVIAEYDAKQHQPPRYSVIPRLRYEPSDNRRKQ
jgi:hypothetical protein